MEFSKIKKSQLTQSCSKNNKIKWKSCKRPIKQVFRDSLLPWKNWGNHGVFRRRYTALKVKASMCSRIEKVLKVSDPLRKPNLICSLKNTRLISDLKIRHNTNTLMGFRKQFSYRRHKNPSLRWSVVRHPPLKHNQGQVSANLTSWSSWWTTFSISSRTPQSRRKLSRQSDEICCLRCQCQKDQNPKFWKLRILLIAITKTTPVPKSKNLCHKCWI